MPTVITISEFQIPDCNFLGTTAKLRRYYDSDWTDVDGVLHLAGTIGSSTDFFDEVNCTLASNTVTVPAFSATPTETALINPNVRETWQLWDEAGSARIVINDPGWFIPSSPTTTTRATLAIVNQGQSLLWPPSDYLNRWGVQQLIDATIGLLRFATSVIAGWVRLSVPAANPADPIAVGDNDPAIPEFTIHTSKYASLNLAITAITALGGGTIVVDSSTPLTSSVATTASIALKFIGQGQLTGAFTVTIVGPLESPPWQIFASALTVSFSGSKVTTIAYPEWWGGGEGVAAATNSAAFNAANTALVTLGAGVIRCASSGTYDINALVTLGSDAVQFTSISLEGVGGLVGTKLNWTGSTSGTAIYVTNARAVNFLNIFINNGVAIGTTIGVLLGGPGPGTGSQTSGVVFSQGHCRGFKINVQIGVASGAAASEVVFSSFGIDNTTLAGTGIKVNGTNSLVIELFRTNILSMDVGLDIASGADTHIRGGSFGRSAIDIRNQGGGPMVVSGTRFEVDPTEIAIQVTNAAPTLIENSTFTPNSTVPSVPIISGKGQFTLLNNQFGSGSNTGWLPIEVDTAGISAGSLVMISNKVYGTNPFYIAPGQTTSNNLTYTLVGNEKWVSSAFDSRFPDEAGQVVWPNKVSVKRISSGLAGASLSPDQITANTNNYLPLNNQTGFGVNAPMYLRLTTDASRNITGLTFLIAPSDGQTLELWNVGSFNIVLVHQSGLSTAANRFLNTIGEDLTIAPNEIAILRYDGTTARWRVSWDTIGQGTTGSGNVVLDTAPTLVTPILGAATGTSLTLSGNAAVGGVVIRTQATPSTPTSVTTLTIANLLIGVLTATPTATGATVVYTLPTGTDMGGGATFATNDSFDWSITNLAAAAADTITITANTDHTIVGNPIVQSAHVTTGGITGNSAVFRSRKISATVWVTYRLS